MFAATSLGLAAILMAIYTGMRGLAPNAGDAVAYALAISYVLSTTCFAFMAWMHTRAEERSRRSDLDLQAAKQAAEAANHAKSRYLVGITHELRTPLNAILGYAQLLENDQTVPEHRRTGVRTIRRSSEHLADLIEGLLDISKIEAGRIDVYRAEFNLHELLDQITATFAIEARAKGLAFTADIAEQVPVFVFADERRLRQILINLLSNAIRYTDKGKVHLSVSFRNDIAQIAVTDTGRGIPRSEWDRILRRSNASSIRATPSPVQGWA